MSGIREVVLVINPRQRRDFTAYIKKNAKKFPTLTFHMRTQETPGGNGHAVAQAYDVIGNEPFAVRFCDDILLGNPPALKGLIDIFNHYHSSVLLLERSVSAARIWPRKVLNWPSIAVGVERRCPWPVNDCATSTARAASRRYSKRSRRCSREPILVNTKPWDVSLEWHPAPWRSPSIACDPVCGTWCAPRSPRRLLRLNKSKMK